MVGVSLTVFVVTTAVCPIQAEGQDLSERSPKELLEMGRALIGEKKFVEALEPLQWATIKDPKNAEAWFLIGSINVEHTSVESGMEALEKCRQLEPRRPRLHLFLGIGHLERARYTDAIKAFTEERTISGDRPETACLLGFAHMGLKENAQAEAEFSRVPQKGDPFSGRAQFNLGLLAFLNDKDQAGTAYIRAAIEAEQDPERKAAFAQHLETLEQRQQPPRAIAEAILQLREILIQDPFRSTDRARKTISVLLRTSFEYDDNVALVRSKDVLINSSVDEKEDARVVVQLGMEWVPLQFSSFESGVRLNGYQSSHFDEATVNYSQASASPFVVWSDWDLRLDVSGFYTPSGVGGSRYEENRGGSASLHWLQTDWTTSQLHYQYTHRDVLLPSSTNPPDRDGDVADLQFQQFFKVAEWNLTINVGGSYQWQKTEGSDYDRTAWSLFAGMGYLLPYNIYGTIDYAFLLEDYENKNSVGNFQTSREDRRHSFSTRFMRPMNEWMGLFAEYRYVENSSNIDPFEYNDNTWAFGTEFWF